MPQVPDNETRRRILEVAGELFASRGYAGVKLRDIAGAVAIHHASLYYYAPGGKEQLFIEVMERSFQQHREGLTRVIQAAGTDLTDRLHAAAAWLITQPLPDMGRMYAADLRDLPPEKAASLLETGYNALRLPLVQVLKEARDAGIIVAPDLNLTAMAIVSLVQSVHTIPSEYLAGQPGQREWIAHHLIEMLLNGIRVR